jgi:hypothetical protein
MAIFMNLSNYSNIKGCINIYIKGQDHQRNEYEFKERDFIYGYIYKKLEGYDFIEYRDFVITINV